MSDEKQPAPEAAEKKKPARLGMSQIMQVSEHLKRKRDKLEGGVLSAAGAAAQATQDLGYEVTAAHVVNIGAGAGIKLPDLKPTERIAILEKALDEAERQLGEARGQLAPKAA